MPELGGDDILVSKGQVLDEAKRLITGDRNQAYDEPIVDFTRTAAMWSAYTGHHFDPHDVAVLMILVKVSRLASSPDRMDHWVDIAGYAGCGGEVQTRE